MTPTVIAKLQSQTYRHGETVWSESAVALSLAAPGSVAQYSSAGFAIGRIAGDEVELLSIAVDPSQQRLGEGSNLLQQFVEAALEAGATSIVLEVSEANVGAVTFYAKKGFETVGRRKKYYRSGALFLDAIVMRKHLDPASSDTKTC